MMEPKLEVHGEAMQRRRGGLGRKDSLKLFLGEFLDWVEVALRVNGE